MESDKRTFTRRRYSASRSPYNRRSKSPHKRRSRSPYNERSRSPYNERSRSPYNERSRSPPYSRRSKSPHERSKSPYKSRRSKSPYKSKRSNRNKRSREETSVASVINGKTQQNRYSWGKVEDVEDRKSSVVKEKANFGLSGALSKDVNTGNVVNGEVLKFSKPADARVPMLVKGEWRLYVFKKEETVATYSLVENSVFLLGRDRSVVDILMEHASCSKQHAAIVFRSFEKYTEDYSSMQLTVKPYLIDLESTHGTLLNGNAVEASRYIELKSKDMLRFGASTREYMFMKCAL